jgi:hypothetical protein
VRRKKGDDVVIVKSQPSRAQAQRIRGQVDLAAQNAGLDLRGAIAAIAKAFENER